MDGPITVFVAIAALCVGVVVWALNEDAKDMARKREAFTASCLSEGRKPYDCAMQWDTFAAVHSAEIRAASAAAGSSAAVSASRGGR